MPGELNVTALPANHITNIPLEQAYHYLFKSTAGTLLYALNDAELTKPKWLLIDSVKLGRIVTDCTMAEEDNWQIFEYNDLTTKRRLLMTFCKRSMIGEETRIVLN